MEAFSDETGWHHSEFERWERVSDYALRCHRCQGVATSISDVGYCEPEVGDLIETHEEYTRTERGCSPVKWVKNSDGVLHPHKVAQAVKA